MKLELKHILPYIDHELFALALDREPSPVVSIVTGMVGLLTDDTDNIEYFDLSDIKPILNPLSTLHESFFIDFPYKDINTLKVAIYGRVISLKAYQTLIEYHFDIFGLIDNGLAIAKV